MLIARKDKI